MRLRGKKILQALSAKNLKKISKDLRLVSIWSVVTSTNLYAETDLRSCEISAVLRFCKLGYVVLRDEEMWGKSSLDLRQDNILSLL